MPQYSWVNCKKPSLIKSIETINDTGKKFRNIDQMYSKCVQNAQKQTFQILKNYQPRFDRGSSRYRFRVLQAVTY